MLSGYLFLIVWTTTMVQGRPINFSNLWNNKNFFLTIVVLAQFLPFSVFLRDSFGYINLTRTYHHRFRTYYLDCFIANSDYTIFFKKDNKDVETGITGFSSSFKTLTLTNFTSALVGNYTCVAKHKEGTFSTPSINMQLARKDIVVVLILGVLISSAFIRLSQHYIQWCNSLQCTINMLGYHFNMLHTV